jgi:hypothetical protein
MRFPFRHRRSAYPITLTLGLTLAELEHLAGCSAENQVLRAQAVELFAIARECASFGPALQRAVDMYTVAHQDLQQMERSTGVRRPSYQATRDLPTQDFAALWCSALAIPD